MARSSSPSSLGGEANAALEKAIQVLQPVHLNQVAQRILKGKVSAKRRPTRELVVPPRRPLPQCLGGRTRWRVNMTMRAATLPCVNTPARAIHRFADLDPVWGRSL
jgi:hypothetical protein